MNKADPFKCVASTVKVLIPGLSGIGARLYIRYAGYLKKSATTQ
jgi:hypothetical protein